MGLLLGLFFGIGLLLVIWSFMAPVDATARGDGRLITRSRDLLASAGVEGVTPDGTIVRWTISSTESGGTTDRLDVRESK